MSRSYFTFNGESSLNHYLTIEYLPNASFPERRGESYQIAGKNGVSFWEDGTYNNYEQIFQVWLRDEETSKDLYAMARDVAQWLLGSSGFCRLEDSYNPGTFRLARFAGPMSFEADLRENGRASLVFDCKPQRYTTAGETAITLFANVDLSDFASVTAATADVVNSTPFPAKPLLRVTGTGNVGFSSENIEDPSTPMMMIELDLGDSSDVTATIDCESYEISGVTPADVSFISSSYPVLTTLWTGTNRFSALYGITDPGTITKLEIIPRWWTL